MASLHEQPSVTFIQLAAGFTLMLMLILFAGMGIVDGLKFRRVRLRYGVLILATIRGVPAQIIGGICVLAEVAGIGFLIYYVKLLGNYCGANVSCFVVTPVTGLFAEWPLIIGNAIVLFCFFAWLRGRLTEVAAPTDKLAYSLPTVYRYVNGKLALAHEPSMNRPEVEKIMEFVEQHAPFVVLSGAKQVMDDKRIDPDRLAGVFLADKQFHDKGQRTQIALKAVTEAYAATKQPSKPLSNRQ